MLKDQIDLNIPEVESTVRLSGARSNPVFQTGNKDPLTSDLVFADKDFFNIFSYKATEGSLKASLNDPMSLVISKSLATKLFGSEQAVGKTIKLNSDFNLTITAVFEDPKDNSCLSFNAITSNDTKKIVQPNGNEFAEWNFINFNTFILLKNEGNPEEVAKNILGLIPDYLKEQSIESGLVPLRELYFSKVPFPVGTYIQFGDRNKILILLLVASLVLLIALVNFINISSYQWLEKIKQTGVMKIIGAKQSAIFRNILLEAFLLFFIALNIAIILILIISPTYSELYRGTF